MSLQIYVVVPPRQRTCRSMQQTNTSQFKKEIRLQEREMAEELPGVLWANQTTPKRATRETHFSIMCNFEAVIHLEFI